MRKLLATTAMILALSGAAYATPGGQHDGPPPHVKEALAKLPQDRADFIASSLKQMHESRKGSWEEGKKLHEEIRGILTAPKFDKTAFLAKTEQAAKLHESKRQQRNEQIADLAAKLSADERKVLAEILPGGGHRKHHGTPPAPPSEE